MYYTNKDLKENYTKNKFSENKFNQIKEPNQKDKDLSLKSINNRRCLSKCYSKGKTYLHPVLLTGIADKTNNSCAIDPVYSNDPQYYKENDMIYADTCKLENNEKYQQPDELESILLSFYFNPSDFLSSIYNINSFDDAIFWTLENDYLPFNTIKRVHNCAWKVFGSKLLELSNNVIQYYYNIAKEHWMKDYISVLENKYSFDFITSSKNHEDSVKTEKEIYDIVIKNYFTFHFFFSAIKNYIYEFKNEWEIIYSHYNLIKKYVFQQLVEEIQNGSKK